MVVSKIAGRVTNSVDPDQMPRSVRLICHCFLKLVCPNTSVGKYGIFYQIEHPRTENFNLLLNHPGSPGKLNTMADDKFSDS